MDLSARNWNVVSKAIMGASGILAVKLVQIGWRTLHREDPPVNPASPKVSWKEAIALTTATGVLGGLIKLSLSRGIASYWLNKGGALPDKKKAESPIKSQA